MMRVLRVPFIVLPFIFALMPFPASAQNVFEMPKHIRLRMHECVQKGDYWDVVVKKCKTRAVEKPASGTPLMPNCVWANQTVELDATRHIAVAFRYQKCGKEKPRYILDPATGMLFRDKIVPKTQVAEFFDYAPGSLTAIIEQKNAATLKEDEKPDCEIVFNRELQSYAYVPTQAYMMSRVLQSPPFSACGNHGFSTVKKQFFRVLGDKILVFFRLDPRGEILDPLSFRLQ